MNESAPTPLTLGDTLERVRAGAQIVDVRSAEDFEAGHVVGSIFLGLGGKLEGWASLILDDGRPVILVADAGDEQMAVERLGDGGITNVVGYLEGGFAALAEERELTGSVGRLGADALAAALAGDHPPTVVDVREEHEYGEGHIEGALNVPLSELRERVGDVPGDANVVLHCRSGYRSAIAASILVGKGYRRLQDFDGGWLGWCERG